MSVLYGDEGIRHRLDDSAARRCSSPTPPTPTASTRPRRRGRRARRRSCSRAPRPTSSRRHRRRRPGPALLHLGHHRPGQGHRPRPPLPARPRGVRLLPRRPGRRALPRHGRMGVGGRDRAAARALAARRRPVRLPARGRLRPARAARLPLATRRHERVHHADGDARDDGDRRRRRRATRSSSAIVCSAGRAAEPRGDPLVPRAVRGHRARLLRADRVLPAVRQLPVHGGARGLDGPADAGLGRADPRRGRAARWPPGERGEICLRARSNPHYPLGYWNRAEATRGGLRRRVVPHQGRGARWTRTATSGTRAAPTT